MELADLRTQLDDARARHTAAIDAAKEIHERAHSEKRSLSEDEASAWEEKTGEANSLKTDLSRIETLIKLEESRSSSGPGGSPDKRPTPQVDTGEGAGGVLVLTEKEQRSYSLYRFARAVVTADWRDAEFERECHQEIEGQLKRSANGYFAPANAIAPLNRHERRAMESIERRAVEKGGTATGAALVETELHSERFIDLLRNTSRVIEAGATVMSDLQGDIDIPRQSGTATASWIAEGADGTPSNLDTDLVSLRPNTLSVISDITRRMMKQGSLDVEDLTRRDQRSVIGLAVDLAAINGPGTGNAPTGVLNQAGIGAVVTGGGLTWAEVVEFETDINTANADMGALAYMTNAAIFGTMKTTVKESGQATYLIEGNQANGYPVHRTNQIPASTMIFGNWRDLLIGQWGALDMFPDPYTLGDSAGVRLRSFVDGGRPGPAPGEASRPRRTSNPTGAALFPLVGPEGRSALEHRRTEPMPENATTRKVYVDRPCRARGEVLAVGEHTLEKREAQLVVMSGRAHFPDQGEAPPKAPAKAKPSS